MGGKDFLLTIVAVCLGLLAIGSFMKGSEEQLQTQTSHIQCVQEADGI